jgi:hypothetical protein
LSGDDKPRCLLCGSTVKQQGGLSGPGGTHYSGLVRACKICGIYTIDKLAEVQLRSQAADERFRIACVLKEMRLQGNEQVFGLVADASVYEGKSIIKIFPVVGLGELASRFPKPTDMIDRGLLNLTVKVAHPMDLVEYDWTELAFCLFAGENNVRTAMRYLAELNLIHATNQTSGSVYITIRPEGWQRVEGLHQRKATSCQAFVAMWFDESMSVFEKAIADAIEDEKFEFRIIKNVEHNNDICDEIEAEIRRSRFVVADFTAGRCIKCDGCEGGVECRDMVRSRGGVYFEAGFARGLEIPVIWTVQKEQIEQVHFDVRQYNFIVYGTPEELRHKLRSRIAATVH